MNGLPDHEPENPQIQQVDSGNEADDAVQVPEAQPEPAAEASPTAVYEDAAPSAPIIEPPAVPEQPMFQQWYVEPPRPPARIPHMGHVGILIVFVLSGLFAAGILMQVALRFHLFGVHSLTGAITDIHFTLGTEIIVYVVMFAACLIFFPMIWHEGFFKGIQWNGATALRLRKQLFITAAICFALAIVNGLLLPSPKNAPIDKIFRTPGAAWLLFGFGITIAPFFEEMIFRGFILPSMCTACDWFNEKTTHAQVRPLAENGHPQWSFTAMVAGSILTSVPFAAMHAAQTGYSWGPFVLLVGVSLVLCWARLSTRSLAASVLVHASYNFLLFSLMMLGTAGFRHMDKL